MNLCVLNFVRPNILGCLLRYSTSAAEIAGASEQVIFEDEEDTRIREEELERKRNVSRLSPAHFNLVNGRRPYEYPMCSAHKTVKYNRKLYGKHGSASGINPSKLSTSFIARLSDLQSGDRILIRFFKKIPC